MITIPLSTEDFTKGRLAPSPLWETVTSFGVLLHQARHTMRTPCCRDDAVDSESESLETLGPRLWHPGRHATDVAGLPNYRLKCVCNRTTRLRGSTNGAAHTSRDGRGAPRPRTTRRADDYG